jgi:hypothetical protein
MIVTERRPLEDALFLKCRDGPVPGLVPSRSLTIVFKTPHLRKDRPFLFLPYRFETLAFLLLALIRRLAF